ncbi:putative bifunctional diguanylate cyclase/phosphodiesterase [Campylobacter concisus]|uniref:putative bifunctional diguanylate cyclase/phosphodiesterase n=1 Tax=Campylobacter concisus TaxID=199 RepID=UPI000CD98DF6|nr:GGDEF domain-containing phosphodiesterase [Campylobacter concisus]
MINKISNENQASFLFVVALFCAYIASYLFNGGFYADITYCVFDFMIMAFIFFKLRETKNLKTYWIYIILGLACWIVADIIWIVYDKLDIASQFMSKTDLIQDSYIVSFFMFAFCAFYILIKNFKNLFVSQALIDSAAIIIIYVSFVWFVVLDESFSRILTQREFFNLLYIIVDIVMFCALFVILFSINFSKRRASLFLCLLSLFVISTYDVFFTVMSFWGNDTSFFGYDIAFKISFFILFTASLHLREGEANLKFRAHREDFEKILRQKLAVLIIFLIGMILFSAKIDIMWWLFVMITLLAYGALTYTVSSTRKMDILIKHERYIKKKLNDQIEDNVKKLEETNRHLLKISKYDYLTNALNRQYFIARLEEMVKSKALGEKIDIYSIDINHFKVINDSYGHYVGDDVLVKLALNISSILPQENSLFARSGGDDFIVVIKQNEDVHYREFLYYLLKAISEPIVVDDYKIVLDAKIGISSTLTSEILADDFIMQAETALDAAKKDASQKYIFYGDIKNIIQDRNYIELLLNSIKFDDEFELKFQPQYTIEDKRIVGAEALIRWNSPIKGLVDQAKFIPIAEQSSIINDIGKWVAREAIKQMAFWNKKYNTKLKIGINISPKQIDNVNFASEIIKFIDEYGIEASCVDVEITEASLVNAEEMMQDALSQFSNKGIGISIDDFGTGFSSMSYIKKYPMKCLKIAKELIDNIAKNDIDKDVVKSVITLAKNVELRTIAEGVEDETQLEILKELGCDEVQGYLWGKPMGANDFEELIKSTI